MDIHYPYFIYQEVIVLYVTVIVVVWFVAGGADGIFVIVVVGEILRRSIT